METVLDTEDLKLRVVKASTFVYDSLLKKKIYFKTFHYLKIKIFALITIIFQDFQDFSLGADVKDTDANSVYLH